MTAVEFVRRLKTQIISSEFEFVFFLGAGCSISSGIPDAGALVRQWLPRLKRLLSGDESSLDAWVKEYLPGYDDDRAANFYGRVIEDLFLTANERQKEIDRLVTGKEPSFGYAVLARAMSHDKLGPYCNVVLTTNFDDLVADALYLYTSIKPLVILHDSLIGFARATRIKPLVVKLHGDAQLAPKNTAEETKRLDESVERAMHHLLADTALVFIGYGGNDSSVLSVLETLPSTSLPSGIFWVNDRLPEGKMAVWLQQRGAVWVRHRDFDELMLYLRNEFELPHPDDVRFRKVLDRYRESFETLKERVSPQAAGAQQVALQQAVEKAATDVTDWWGVELEAAKLRNHDPEAADAVYRDGIKQFPNSAPLLGNYAFFLTKFRKDHDAAEEMFKRAIAADPSRANALGNYAIFLTNVRKDHDAAEETFKRAIAADPNRANALANYAFFLADVRKDYDAAEELYKRAIAADPNHANALSNYAIFLTTVRKDHDAAEETFKRAIAADANEANALSSYARFLTDERKDHDAAEELFKRAIAANPNHANSLSSYAIFLIAVRNDHDAAEEMLKRAIAADPNHANALSNYAVFLTGIRKDHIAAEKLFKRAIAADPNHASALGSYANFLTHVKKQHDAAEELYERAIVADSKSANNLGNYAGFLLARGRRAEGFNMLDKSLALATYQPLILELWFYRCAHGQDDTLRSEGLGKVKKLLAAGVRSTNFDLSANVKEATTNGHPWPLLLGTLAEVIADAEPLSALDRYPEWQAA